MVRPTRVVWILLLSVASCVEPEPLPACGPELSGHIDAMGMALGALRAQVDDARADASVACEAIARDLDVPLPGSEGLSPTEHMEIVCTIAETAVQGRLAAGTTLQLVSSPPVCPIDGEAQLACETQCDLGTQCRDESLAERCPEGDVIGHCDGLCQPGATCIASSSAVPCSTLCEGECQGDCAGAQSEAGLCEGDCVGQCLGSCNVTGSARACGDAALCRGTCEGTRTGAGCATPLSSPACALHPVCVTACDAEARHSIRCTVGHVSVATAPTDAVLEATLEDNLPALVAVRDGFAPLWASTDALFGASARVGSEIALQAACATSRAAAFGSQLELATAAALDAEDVTRAAVRVLAAAADP